MEHPWNPLIFNKLQFYPYLKHHTPEGDMHINVSLPSHRWHISSSNRLLLIVTSFTHPGGLGSGILRSQQDFSEANFSGFSTWPFLNACNWLSNYDPIAMLRNNCKAPGLQQICRKALSLLLLVLFLSLPIMTRVRWAYYVSSSILKAQEKHLSVWLSQWPWPMRQVLGFAPFKDDMTGVREAQAAFPNMLPGQRESD